MNRLFFKPLVFVIVGLLWGCSSESPKSEPRQNEQFQLQKVECWFDYRKSYNVECFYFHVPQNYAHVEDLWIYFPIVKVTAKTSETSKNPVLHLGGGGPGNPIGFWTNTDASWLFDRYATMSVDNGRDLYIIDPRGVGNAFPALECAEYVDMIEQVFGQAIDSEKESQLSAKAYTECRDRLQLASVDLSQYHSANVARDINQLAAILNIPKWNLYGASYGTRYAQTIARDFPNITESMILDAAVFMDIKYTERSGKDYMQTFERLFQYCENESRCKRALGEVRNTFWRLIKKLNSEPIAYEIDHPNQDGKISIMLNGSRFLNAYYNALYDASNYADLPNIIQSVGQNKLGKFTEPLADWVAYVTDRFYGDGAAISHYCREEAPFINYEKALAGLSVLPDSVRLDAEIGLNYSKTQCETWMAEPQSPIEGQALHTQVPTLFLHGALDPVLPVEDIDQRRHTFIHSDKVVFDDISHTVIGSSACGSEVAKAFYDHKINFRGVANCL